MGKKKLLYVFFFLFNLSLLNGQEYNLGDHELFLMPTAKTIPQGYSYFAGYELFILNYTYAVTERTHISALVLFPITLDALKTFSVGVKQNYYRGEIFQGALFGTFTIMKNLATLGNVFSLGGNTFNAHLGGAMYYNENNVFGFTGMLGVKYKVNKKFSLVSELIGSSYEIEEDMIIFGVRLMGKSLFWDLGAFRPLKMKKESSLLFFPFFKASYMF